MKLPDAEDSSRALPERAPHDARALELVVIGGGSGFVGRSLAKALAGRFRIAGLSRSGGTPDETFSEWRKGDLFNLRDAEAALEGARYAIYLVHSMVPSARLTQGSFRDFDLICADNFARAAAHAGVEQIVYLGGLIPEGDRAHLSPHLESRLEVEKTLARYGVPVTTLRAGLVIGEGGSSFEMMVRLVERLPFMVCPRWTLNRTQPIAQDDVIALLAFAVGNRECFGQEFDVGGRDTPTYRDLMASVAELTGKKRTMVPVRFVAPSTSRLWVTLVTGAPSALVGPLVESLRHEMLARDDRLAKMAGLSPKGVKQALSEALAARAKRGRDPFAEGSKKKRGDSVVRSVQRMKLPPGRDATWAAAEYTRWLPAALRDILRVEVDDARNCRFYVAFFEEPLLVLTYVPERSKSDRELFFVSEGLLVKSGLKGRFELRQALDDDTLITAIHDFGPRLPWFVYRQSQARVHGLVMAAFRRHLARVGRLERKTQLPSRAWVT